MIDAMDALDAWWPPTLSPLGLGRTLLAESLIAVDSQSARCLMAPSTANPWPSAAAAGSGPGIRPEYNACCRQTSQTAGTLCPREHHRHDARGLVWPPHSRRAAAAFAGTSVPWARLHNLTRR